MEFQWQNNLTELASFIAGNPSICIDRSNYHIPNDLRGRFYAIFNGVRQSFVEENFALLLVKGRAMSEAWTKTKTGFEQADFGPVEIPATLKVFIDDPLDGLMRPLFNPLISLLRRQMDMPDFEHQGLKEVAEAFSDYYRLGYLYWVQLAFLVTLQIDKNYRVPVEDNISDVLMGEGHENPGDHIGNIPELEECTNISFVQNPVVSFVTPQVIVRSTKTKNLLGLRTDFVEPQWITKDINSRLDWFNLPVLLQEHGIEKPRPDYKLLIEYGRIMSDILVYTADNEYDIRILADYGNFLRPDMCLEVMEQSDWYEKGKLGIVKKHHSIMQPRYGTYIICLDEPPQAAFDELVPKFQDTAVTAAMAENTLMSEGTTLSINTESADLEQAKRDELTQNMHIIHCGFDEKKLETLIGVMVPDWNM